MDAEEFRHDFLQRANVRASADSQFAATSFFELCAEFLIEAEEISSYESIPYRGKWTRGRLIQIEGLSWSENDGLLTVFVSDFRYGKPGSLTQTDVNATFQKATGFVEAAVTGELHPKLEPSSPGFTASEMIYTLRNRISRFRIYLLSDALLSDRVTDYEAEPVAGIPAEYHIWDIGRFHRVESSQYGREDIRIDLMALFGRGIPCLSASHEKVPYKSYLCVVPGEMLTQIYEHYGERLLEQNVRTFLQVRSDVNKGLRATLLGEPAMFFAYNNGITTTAVSVETRAVEAGGIELVTLTNLQIVNGGQTTASMFWAKKRDKADLSKVFVQMKLSVIEGADTADMVARISQYANSQNKVSAADFFSNHPYHLRIEELSRRIWAPAVEGAQHETHWFYERARGQFLNAQAPLTPAQRRRYLQENPRSQMFTKTDLAKFENCWLQRPNVVSQGAQKNFASFAKEIEARWLQSDAEFSERYFKDLVSRAILFRTTEKLVSDQSWYDGGYRANIVTYTIAKLSHSLQAQKKELNWQQIWNRQVLSDSLKASIAQIAHDVWGVLSQPEAGRVNISEWAKVELCWQRVMDLDNVKLAPIKSDVIGTDRAAELRRDAAEVQDIDSGIAAQTKVLKLGQEHWKRLLKWNESSRELTPQECEIVMFATGRSRLPSEKQSKWLLSILEKAERVGFR